ncbi:hypothetical protein Pint_01304 [Pistacia integerrima]|uniref:Uncharacterized protein n=1 Tax=Pistacia integerrima TaxID=434235 RepID=A0ACC0ZIL4_9ROSI|nr:hypothetical protein Pint_01304 [Pistacia integerrima]
MTGKAKAKERREKRLQEVSLLRTIPYSDHQRWWSSDTVAVVTGANRGIGFEIARQLAGHGLTVILTSRDTSVGLEAAKVLQEGGFNVDVHQLDVLEPSSIEEFCEWIREKYGGIDILVNNAGVNYNIGSDNSVEFAKDVIATNYNGTKSMIKAMIPLMRPSSAGARIVSVSSRLGKLNGRRNRTYSPLAYLIAMLLAHGLTKSVGDYSLNKGVKGRLENPTLRQQLGDLDTLSEELIDRTIETFLKEVEEDTWKSGGWPQTLTDYSMSKLAVNAHTRLMAKILSDRPEGEKIYINCFCPGWVKTAMTGWAGNVSAENGADTGVWLSLLPDQAITGKFFAERREISF